MHEDFFAQYAADGDARGLRDATAAPRGFAKTTVRGKIKILHDCVYELERYILVISSRDDLAIDKVKDIREEFETNARLIAVYGRQVGRLWNMGDFITTQGVRVRAASRGSQVRGLLWGTYRVTKIVLDDAENSELVLTDLQRQKMVAWFTEDITKLGDEHTNIEVIGTVLHEDSLLAKLLHNPGYRQARYQAVLTFASAVPLWQQWRDLFLDLTNPRRQEDARAFYAAHEAAMLAGSAVLWPERYSYYRLMVERVVDGDAAFWKERMNLPQKAGDTLFAMHAAGYFRLDPDRLVCRDGRVVLLSQLVDVVAYWDPAIGESAGADWSACIVLGKDAYGYLYVLDAYMSQGASPTAQVNGVVELLWQWRVRRFGYEANLFQSLWGGNIEAAMAQRALEEREHYAPIYVPITNMRNKMIRISSLEPLVTNQHLLFNEALHPEYLRQMTVFRPVDGADKDDAGDATDGGVRVIKHVTEGRK